MKLLFETELDGVSTVDTYLFVLCTYTCTVYLQFTVCSIIIIVMHVLFIVLRSMFCMSLYARVLHVTVRQALYMSACSPGLLHLIRRLEV